MIRNIIAVVIIFLQVTLVEGQTGSNSNDSILIANTLNDYIEGTSMGQPERLRRAFHPDFNLYSVTEQDSLKIWEGEDYIMRIKVGEKNSRKGRIISIDHENNAASAKVEILIPQWRIYTDYFLLLKYEGSWKIVHKSYTWREVDK